MTILKQTSVQIKIFLLSVVLAAVFLGGTLFYIASNIENSFSELAISATEKGVEVSAHQLEDLIEDGRRDVYLIQNTPPLQGLFRAQKNEGVDPLDGSTEEDWKKRLTTIFTSTIDATQKLYDQIRYIDENGQEIVRVNNVDGDSEIVPPSELQYKGNRDYFIAANHLKKGELYISPIELNKEGNPAKISLPYKPVVRYATPIFDEVGKKKGILIINILFEELIKESIHEDLNVEIHQNFIIDDSGQYLFHPDHQKEWGGPENLNNGENFKKDFPQTVVGKILNNEKGHIEYNGELIAFKKVKLGNDQENTLTWIEITPIQKVLSNIKDIINKYSLFGFLIFSLLAIVFYLFIKIILSPLSKLKKSAEMLGEGNFDVNIEIDSQDEIGTLGQAFKQMAKQLKSSYALLKKQVDEKTKELSSKIKDLEKTKKAMLNLLEDINTEKQKITLAKARDEAILNNIGDGLIVMDKKGVVELVNPVFEEQLGWKEKEIKGKLLVDVVKMEDEDGKAVSNQKRLISKAITSNKSVETDSKKTCYYVQKDGNRFPASIIVSPILDGKKCIGYVEVFRNITEEKEVDRAKTEFVSMASHQLKTPLSTIGWYTEMLVDEDAGKLNKEQKSYLAEIYAGNQRMIELVNSLLNVSRVDLGTFAIECEKMDLLPMCKDVIKTLKPKVLEKKINIKNECSKDLQKIDADPKLLRMVIENLMSNAVKYTPEKGNISLSITKEKRSILIKVKDNGYGIPKHEQKHIFTKLFRAENVRQKAVEGTGLGLYIVKAVVEQSGGKIRFESEENKGTTFFVTFPLKGMKQKKGTKALS